jgi:hypothetical protein
MLIGFYIMNANESRYNRFLLCAAPQAAMRLPFQQ